MYKAGMDADVKLDPSVEHEHVEEKKPHGLVAVYDNPQDLYHACEALRDAGYKKFDALTPFPVHGLERAMGAPPSRIPWISLAGGVTGVGFMIWLAWYTQHDQYPHVISGKEPFSWQAYVPLFFELMVLFAGIATFVGLWILNKQMQYFHPTFTHSKFAATDDKFLVEVEVDDGKYDPASTKALLEKTGGHDIEEVYK
jgi:hypothetical protein